MSGPGVEDTRRPAFGAGRVLIVAYAVFAVAATSRAGVQLIRNAAEAPVAYGLSAFSAVVYVLATVALAHNGRRLRMVAWVTVVIELTGVIVVGLISVTYPELFPRDTVWSGFGRGYGYVPLVLPVLGIGWLWWSSPRRLSQVNG
ncbi:MAG: hypothetical protein ACK5H2_11745 [Beutenbergiaceae bacterium]